MREREVPLVEAGAAGAFEGALALGAGAGSKGALGAIVANKENGVFTKVLNDRLGYKNAQW